MLSLDATLLLRLVTLAALVALILLKSRSRISLGTHQAGLTALVGVAAIRLWAGPEPEPEEAPA